MTDFIGSITLPLALSAAAFGPLSGWFAGRRDRNPVVWLALGAALGPIALVLLGVAPPGACPSCDAKVAGWPSVCPVCGTPFDERRTVPAGDVSVMDLSQSGGTFQRQDVGTPIQLPVGRPPRARLGPSAQMPVGVMAGGTVARPGGHPVADSAEVLATGVYFGGTVSLSVGSRYAVARHGRLLRILGPVDRDPSTIVIERSLQGLTATAIGERLIISEARGERLAIALGALAGANGPELELALSIPADQATTRPASG